MRYRLFRDTIDVYRASTSEFGWREGLREASWCFWNEVKLYTGEFFSPGYRQRCEEREDAMVSGLETLMSIDRTDYKGLVARAKIVSVIEKARAERREKIRK